MKQMKPKMERRKRGLRWEPAVIEQLVCLNLLEFLPEESIKVHLREHAPSHHLDGTTVRKLDAALSEYSERRLPLSQLRDDLRRVVRVLGKRDGVLQIRTSAESMKYLQGRLGLEAALWPNPLDRSTHDPEANRRNRLRGRSQHNLFLQWMGLEDAWEDHVWQECMLLRYDPRGGTALDWIHESVRTRLDTEAANFRTGSFDYLQAHECVRRIRECHDYGLVGLAIAIEYLRARAQGDNDLIEKLRMSVTESPIFEMIADGKLGGEGEFALLQTACDPQQFRRFLSRSVNQPSQLQGRVLYYLIRLEAWFGSLGDSTIPQDVADLWPKPTLEFHVLPTAEFTLLKEKYIKELGIDKKVFTEIWAAYVTLRMRELRRRRAPASETVFWAARILESIRPDVYNAYRRLVDHIHRIMHKSKDLEGRDGAWLWASIGPFLTGLVADPLLSAVFHSEVLDGRERLMYKPGRGGTDDRLMNLTLVHAHARLHESWPSGKLRRVDTVLADMSELPEYIRLSVSPEYFTTAEAVDAGPTSIFAFLTPLVVAMIGPDAQELRPHKAKSRCMDHQLHPELDALLSDLAREFSSSVRG